MTGTAAETRSVVVEREFAHPPDKIWRALTTPHLIGEWLMQTDFAPETGRPFELRGDWGTVACRVIEIEPDRTLSYSWDAMGLESVVTWTLVPIGSPAGSATLLRMEQAGFRPDQEQAYQGAKYGWAKFFTRLEQVAARADDRTDPGVRGEGE